MHELGGSPELPPLRIERVIIDPRLDPADQSQIAVVPDLASASEL